MTAKLVPASASGAAGYSVHYGYDLRGLQTYARFGSASGAGITNAWDGFGRLASSATSMDGVSRAMASQYDAHGNRILLTGDQGYYAPFSYDGLDRMSAYANLALFGYDAAGRRSSLAMGPGWTSSTAGYGYDPAGRLQTLGHALGGTSADQTLSFAYNPAGQIVTRSGTNAAFASDSAYAVVRPYGVNGLNQYTAAGPETFTYDASGNLASDGSTSFVYDAENRLVAASGAKTASLAYDPLGRLWQVAGPSGTTRFLYDGDRLVMEYNASGAATRSYVHGPGTDEPLVWYDGASGWARRYFHADHQGSIIALNDDNGTPVAINAYDEWGIPNAGNAGRFGYTGQTWIAELGLWYYKARFYSPTLGRFLQVDPIGYEDDVNLYAYVGNDPVNHEDPTGLACTGTRIECDGGIAPGLSGSTAGEFAYYQRGGRIAPPVTRPVGIGGNNARMAPGGMRGQQVPGGHGQSRHIGRTPRQLQERLQRDPRLSEASTFRSEAVANKMLSSAVRQNQERINDWVASRNPWPLEISSTSRPPIGTVLYRGQSTPHAAHTATFVLRQAPSNTWIRPSYDYYVVTGYVH